MFVVLDFFGGSLRRHTSARKRTPTNSRGIASSPPARPLPLPRDLPAVVGDVGVSDSIVSFIKSSRWAMSFESCVII